MVGYAKENGAYNVYDIKQADGYTWYQIGMGQWFASKDNWVSYYPKQEEKPVEPDKPAEPETPTTPETPKEDVPSANVSSLDAYETIDVLEENRRMIATIDEATVNDEKHTITLQGKALFRKMNALEGQVKHNLILTNPETMKSKVIPCTTVIENQSILAGYTTNAVKYTVTLDTNLFNNCNYYIGIQLINGDVSGYYSFFMNGGVHDISCTNESGTLVKLFGDPISHYRYSICAEKQSIDLSVINKPNWMTPKFGASSINIENGHLEMNGYAGIYLTDFTQETNPSYEMILVNEDGEKYSFDCTKSTTQKNITRYMKCNNTYTDCYFDVDADLTQLPAGTYRVYIHVKTTNAEDIFEMYSTYDESVKTESVSNKTYTLSRTNTRFRYILTIQ